MRQRKGFMRMLEAVVASIILFASLTYFFSSKIVKTDWDTNIMMLEASDALAVLDKTGIIENYIDQGNAIGLENMTTNMLRETYGFSYYISGIPKPIIYIGCACSEEEELALRKALLPGSEEFDTMPLNNREIDIRVDNISIDDIPDKTDILVSFNKNNISDNEQQIINFLRRTDHAVVLIDDLDAADLTGTNIFTNVFGLSASTSCNMKQKFSDTTDPSRISYKIANYFVKSSFQVNTTIGYGFFVVRGQKHRLDVVENQSGTYVRVDGTGAYHEGDIFEIDGYNILVRRIDDSEHVDLSVIDRIYEFVLNSGSTVQKDEKSIIESGSCSLAKANEDVVKGKGRTVWIAKYDLTNSDINQLLKSSILWLSDNRWGFDPYDLDDTGPFKPKYPQRTYRTVKRIVAGGSVFGPYEVGMLVWHVFY